MEHGARTLVFLGSSVTYGWASGGVSFVDFIEEQTKVRTIKEAVSGTTLADVDEKSYVHRLHGMAHSMQVDGLVCQLSTNDATHAGIAHGILTLPGDTVDASTTLGAVAEVALWAREVWHCPLMFYTSPRFDSQVYDTLVNQLLTMAQAWGFDVLDLWHDGDFNRLTSDERVAYMADAIHPTRLGYQVWWTPVFLSALQRAGFPENK